MNFLLGVKAGTDAVECTQHLVGGDNRLGRLVERDDSLIYAFRDVRVVECDLHLFALLVGDFLFENIVLPRGGFRRKVG